MEVEVLDALGDTKSNNTKKKIKDCKRIIYADKQYSIA